MAQQQPEWSALAAEHAGTASHIQALRAQFKNGARIGTNDIRTINKNGPVTRQIIAIDQPQQGGFSRPAGPLSRRHHHSLDVEIDIADNGISA